MKKLYFFVIIFVTCSILVAFLSKFDSLNRERFVNVKTLAEKLRVKLSNTEEVEFIGFSKFRFSKELFSRPVVVVYIKNSVQNEHLLNVERNLHNLIAEGELGVSNIIMVGGSLNCDNTIVSKEYTPILLLGGKGSAHDF